MTALALELRKHRRSKLPLLFVGIVAFEVLWAGSVMGISGARSPQGLRALVTSGTYDFLRNAPIIVWPGIAFIATRVVGVDEDSRMGQVYRTYGRSVRHQFFVQVALLTTLGSVLSLSVLGANIAGGLQAGLFVTPSLVGSVGYALAVTVLATLAVSAVQVGLCHVIRSAGGSVVVAVVGSLFASFLPALGVSQLGWALPWGLMAAASPFPGSTSALQGLSDYPIVAGAAVHVGVAALLAVGWTVLSAWIVVRKEENA